LCENSGNVCVNTMAQQLGLPIRYFIASNNENNVVIEYLKTQLYNPKPTVPTISNAMDVGDPSNFIRIQEIYKNKFVTLKDNVSSFRFSDDKTKAAMLKLYSNHNYAANPHRTAGYLDCKAFLEKNPNAHCVFLEMADPTQFLDVVAKVINTKQSLPPQIQSVMVKDKVATTISSYENFKEYLLI
jgi:threonine synthase